MLWSATPNEYFKKEKGGFLIDLLLWSWWICTNRFVKKLQLFVFIIVSIWYDKVVCGSSSPPLSGSVHHTVCRMARVCVHARMSRKSQHPAAASYNVYSPITSTVAELQLANLQCSQLSERPAAAFWCPPVRVIPGPDREVLHFTYLMCADVICA